MSDIVVEKYNPNWEEEFNKAYKFYKNLINGLDVKIEHVGSTSVKGLWAKPILDIDIIVKDDNDSKRVITLLKGVGYKHLGDLGIQGREAFSYEENNPDITWMRHHLYVCLENCENLRNHLLLRKHLRNNPESVKLYSELKKDLAVKFNNDIDAYVDGKTDLISSFLKEEGMKSNELDRIEAVNKK